jgi:hypothetical protein
VRPGCSLVSSGKAVPSRRCGGAARAFQPDMLRR